MYKNFLNQMGRHSLATEDQSGGLLTDIDKVVVRKRIYCEGLYAHVGQNQ